MKNKAKQKECAWTLFAHVDGKFVWQTRCDCMISFTVSKPLEHGYIYCPYCGKKIKM